MTFLDTISSKMEHILSNPGLIDIREQIFGHFDQKTLEICREVFANRFGEDWDSWLERLILVQRILEFGNKFKMKDEKQTFRDFVSGWDKAVKKFGKMASLKDLNEVNGSLLCLFVTNRAAMYWPLHHAARYGLVKLMELLFYTDLNINKGNTYWHGLGNTAFIEACQEGPTEIVNLMVTSSKEFGIDLNARNDRGWTGFMVACQEGHTKIVTLMTNLSEEYGIDLNARDEDGDTGFMLACHEGHTEIVKLMIENRTKFGINIQQENNSGHTPLKIVNKRIKYARGGFKKASFKELKDILEEAYSADNEPQPTV